MIFIAAVSLQWAAVPIFLWWQSAHHTRRWEAKGQEDEQDERRTLVFSLTEWGHNPALQVLDHGRELRYQGEYYEVDSLHLDGDRVRIHCRLDVRETQAHAALARAQGGRDCIQHPASHMARTLLWGGPLHCAGAHTTQAPPVNTRLSHPTTSQACCLQAHPAPLEQPPC